MDMVVNHAAKIHQMFGGKVGVPMVIRTPAGAGAQLTAQHSQSFEVWFAHTPGPQGRRARRPRPTPTACSSSRSATTTR